MKKTSAIQKDLHHLLYMLPKNEYNMAARFASLCEPAKSSSSDSTGRMAFSTRLLLLMIDSGEAATNKSRREKP
jgi:hypothetical protein